MLKLYIFTIILTLKKDYYGSNESYRGISQF